VAWYENGPKDGGARKKHWSACSA